MIHEQLKIMIGEILILNGYDTIKNHALNIFTEVVYLCKHLLSKI